MSSKSEKRRGEDLPREGGESSGQEKSTESRTTPAAAQDRISGTDVNELHLSSKKGVQSSSQKQDKSRYYTEPVPSTTPVPGAFGRSGVLSEAEEEVVTPHEDEESDRTDFLAERRRQNKRARK